MTVTRDQIVQWLEKTAAVLSENKEYLTELDAAIGDADHGINMDRGFRKVMEKLPTVADKDIGNILKTTGMTLISSVGGAAGPLYGTFYLRSGMCQLGLQSFEKVYYDNYSACLKNYEKNNKQTIFQLQQPQAQAS